jgi:hypothetical protein
MTDEGQKLVPYSCGNLKSILYIFCFILLIHSWFCLIIVLCPTIRFIFISREVVLYRCDMTIVFICAFRSSLRLATSIAFCKVDSFYTINFLNIIFTFHDRITIDYFVFEIIKVGATLQCSRMCWIHFAMSSCSNFFQLAFQRMQHSVHRHHKTTLNLFSSHPQINHSLLQSSHRNFVSKLIFSCDLIYCISSKIHIFSLFSQFVWQ